MSHKEAIELSKIGKKLLLPKWQGYFYWNYATQELNFKNGNYHLDSKQLDMLNIKQRDDWYYII